MYQKKPLEESVVYQVYIRSFQDSNNDGIGDIPGVIQRLDYLQDLGVDMIWFSPFCASPNDDMGYDISDYQAIMKEFGTMEDLDRLIEEAHQRDMGIMMDLVLNHSSDEHEWFKESRSSVDNPKRDYYIWKKEPNNWNSYFAPQGWELDEATGEYYYHNFGIKQPDLNWQCLELRQEIFSMVEWWLKKGIDGFRFDAIHLIGKPEGFPDYQRKEGEPEWANHFRNTDLGHQYLRELHDKVLSRYEPVTVGETGGTTVETAPLYVNRDRREFDMIFHFGFLDKGEASETSAVHFKEYFKEWYDSLSPMGWDALFLGNHDMPRQVSLFGDDKKYWRESATALASMILTQWGTPFLYQGEEIGMTNAGFKGVEDFRDPHTIIRYDQAKDKKARKHELEQMILWGRDNSRTPMQWDNSPNGGFSEGDPWIGMAKNWKKIHVEKQDKDPHSILNYYRKAIALRKQNRALCYGDMTLLESSDDCLAYMRCFGKEGVLVILNLSSKKGEKEADLPDDWKKLNRLLGNYEKPSEEGLRPWEARIYSLVDERIDI